jgi:hypothetical protein
MERATQLHHELEELMNTHNKRVKEELQTPIYEHFFGFIKRNKGEMINIGAAFICTLLAYQIVGLRKAGHKLEQLIKDKQQELEEKKALLSSLTDASFVEPLAQRCMQAIDEQQTGRGWSRKSSPDVATDLASIIQQELKRRIGDAGLSEQQKKDLMMTKLQQEQKALLESKALLSSSMEEEEPVEVIQDDAGVKIVKKRKFAI